MATDIAALDNPEIGRETVGKALSPRQVIWRRFLKNRMAVIGMISFALLILFVVVGSFIITEDIANAVDLQIRLSNPSNAHLMGTDETGREIFARIIHGGQISLFVGFTSVILSVVLGTLIGGLSGYFGGWVDNTIMRVMDVVLAFPSLLLAIAIVTVLGPGLINALLAIGIVSIPAYARVVRGSVLSVREMDYVSATRSLGGNTYEILFRRILPNALTPLIVQGTLGIASAILETAALSFLGLGAQHPTPEWGSMLGQERNQVFTAPHLVFYPGLAIMLTVLAFNLLGDGLRDALDPRLAHVS